MNLDKAKEIFELYKELHEYAETHGGKLWDTYVQARHNAYADYGEKASFRSYTFDHIEFDLDEKAPRLAYEYYFRGDSDYEYLPIEWLFDEDLYTTVYNETVPRVQRMIQDREDKADAYAREERIRELAQLRRLREKYPEE